ncbi:Thioesterase/thiol ester dehydrase-isomerase [Violaceomyces palustris]|uniref:Thioesterase/thiol ester dehydrase-isomerase n=1 Tax=Violaceomyces palustris TaxID=1673888 RepID=A0ACD0NVG3_9BASI|nr:Thioesterase/thiol ester dehydrase-isomerase [Violaceomyces palustris]
MTTESETKFSGRGSTSPSTLQPSRTFLDLIRLRRVEGDAADVFRSVNRPEKMGNLGPIAYGGCVIALVIASAYQTVKEEEGFKLYSFLGNFLGPTRTDREVNLKVTRLRETRTFQTRLVIASQILEDGEERKCFSATLDFMTTGPGRNGEVGGSIIHREGDPNPFRPYSVKPIYPRQHHSQLERATDLVSSKVESGQLSRSDHERYKEIFGLFNRHFDTKLVPGSIHADNIKGFIPGAELSQVSGREGRKGLTERYTCDWFKVKEQEYPPSSSEVGILPTSRKALNASSLAFALDGALSFLPLTFSNLGLNQASACSSLECSLRFHSPDFDSETNWAYREQRTISGSDQRTFSESYLFDENDNLIATMSQISVLRPLPDPISDRSTGLSKL